MSATDPDVLKCEIWCACWRQSPQLAGLWRFERHLSANSSIGATCQETTACRPWKWTGPHSSSTPFLREPPGLERREDVGKNLLLRSVFLKVKNRRMIQNLRSFRRKKTMWQSLLRRLCPTVDWTALTADMCKVDGNLAAVLSLIMFETGTVRSRNCEADVTISLDSRLC